MSKKYEAIKEDKRGKKGNIKHFKAREMSLTTTKQNANMINNAFLQCSPFVIFSVC